MQDEQNRPISYKQRIYNTIFEANTFEGKLFDVILIVSILLSSLIIMLDSVHSIKVNWSQYLNFIEWGFTILFTIEYFLRVYSSPKKFKYIFSFFGVIDFISTFPIYTELFFGGIQILLVVRIFRVLRVFRILKLLRFIEAGAFLSNALWASRHKILIFLGFILTIVIIMGALMFVIEGPVNGYTSIPRGIYWAIVTLTTVGYGDIAPHTNIGQTVAAFIMILGYSILAVPTGIITSEMNNLYKSQNQIIQLCKRCGEENHLIHSHYCHKCGEHL